MNGFFAETHHSHQPRLEFTGGALIPAFDQPARVDSLASALRVAKGFSQQRDEGFGMALIAAIHPPRYLTFLQTAYADWLTAGLSHSPMASNTAPDQTGVAPKILGVSYYSDGAVLLDGLDVPFVILGPGELGVSGQVDKTIPVQNLRDVIAIYCWIAERWQG